MPLTAGQLRRRIEIAEQSLEALARVAMHPLARGAIAVAKGNLDTASRRLTRANPLDIDNLDVWIRLVETRVELVRGAIASGGPGAVPAFPRKRV